MIYQPRLPPDVADVLTHLPPTIKQDVKRALRVLSTDPRAGIPLKRELKGFWKYRMRSFRIVYQVCPESRELRILAIGHRRHVYDLVRLLEIGDSHRFLPRHS